MTNHLHTDDHVHDHDHDHSQNPALAGNIDIAADETAEAAYTETYENLPVYTMAQQVDDIDNFATWDADSVSFSFPTEESDDYIGNWREGTLNTFSAAQETAAREVIAMIGDLIDVDFVDSGTDVDADIRMYNSTIAGTAAGAPAGEGVAGDMWVYNYDPDTIDGYDLTPGGYQWHLLVHEMGHIMGLSHTTISAGDTYDQYATYLQNNQAYTQMSYTRAVSGGLDWQTSYATTPMIIDIAALQSIYGANMETRDGNTVYGFNSTADRDAFDFDAALENYGAIGAIAIWDGGGVDTLDLSKFGEDGFINLGAGTHSSVGGYDFNVSIAHGATIERAIAGAGDDVILGNEVNNRLIGNLGNDTLTGGAGNDQLYGDARPGTGPDFGDDFNHQTVILSGNQSIGYAIDGTALTEFTIEVLVSFDTEVDGLQWFSELPGGAWLAYDSNNQGVWLWASNGSWHFTGVRIEDVADEDLHRLSLSYDGANNTVQVYFDGSARNTLQSDSFAALDMDAEETVRFSNDGGIADIRIFDDIRTAEEIRLNTWSEIDADTEGLISYVVVNDDGATDVTGGNVVTITDGALYANTTVVDTDDVLNGGTGNDVLFGGLGADQLNGGEGSDTANYTTSNAAVSIDLAAGVGVGGDASGDVLTSIEKVTGSQHDDRLSGSALKDVLKGGAGEDLLIGLGGHDKLIGGGASDILIGGLGNDKLIGGGGADTFVFGADDGRDKLQDFTLDQDVIAFGADIAFADLDIQDHAQGSIIRAENTTIVVVGVTAAEFTQDQFEFWQDDSALSSWDNIA